VIPNAVVVSTRLSSFNIYAYCSPGSSNDLPRYYQVNVSDYKGNKGLSYRGLHRLQEFCDKSFDILDQERKTTIVVGGHSLWFKNFFKMFLPAEPHSEPLASIATKNKIANGGMVRFILQVREAIIICYAYGN
jgi:hypothetical protein